MLERYQLRRELHSGADGVVWQARDRESRQVVAVKIVREEAAIARLRRAAVALSRVRHANVVPFVAEGACDDGWCLVTEHLDGAPLAKVLRVTSPSPPRAVGWMRQVAAGLAACHAAGVVHGDLQPAHVWMGRDAVGRDRLVLMGFERAVVDGVVPEDDPGFLPATASERFAGAADARSDVFAAGALLYRLLVERWPFEGADRRAPPPLGQYAPSLRLPPGLEEIVFRCLSRSPDVRFATAEELGRRLEAVEYLPQRDWVRVAGLDLTIPPPDDAAPAGGPRVPLAVALVAIGLLLVLWLAMTSG